MFELRTEILISRPVEEVFNFVADNENDPQWCIPVVETVRIAGDAPGIGAKYKFASKVGLLEVGGEFETVEFKPLERIEWSGTSPFNDYTGYYDLQVDQGGTRLVEVVRFESKGIFKLFASRMNGQFQGNYDEQMRKLKQLLEAT